MLPMRGSSAAHEKAEDHKSERAFTREQQFGYAFKRNCLLQTLRNGSTFLSKSCAATPFGSACVSFSRSSKSSSLIASLNCSKARPLEWTLAVVVVGHEVAVLRRGQSLALAQPAAEEENGPERVVQRGRLAMDINNKKKAASIAKYFRQSASMFIECKEEK